jgi:citrate lyase subunit beta/citryl-CoA lyase
MLLFLLQEFKSSRNIEKEEEMSGRDKKASAAGKKASASAGRIGEGVRSDLHAAVTVGGSGGVEVALQSKVEILYGTSIRETVETTLAAFGVENATVEIVDMGALPYVIAARVETALRRAGLSGRALPDRTIVTEEPTAKNRLRRSRLYLPGNEPKFAISAGIHRPDGVILDLEDSVHPNEKDAARVLVRNALRCVDFMGAERMVRINQLPLGMDDLEEIVPEAPDLILIPKVEHAEEVLEFQGRITEIQKRESNDRPIWLMPILESALGVENAYQIATAADTVVALTIGLEDFTADMGVRKTKEGGESLYARQRLVNAARAAGVQAIDSVYGDVGDMDGLRSWGQRARAMGFEGMGCIHPRQIRTIHEAFAPSTEEIEKALKIVAAFDEATEKGLGVVSLGTRMVDPPVVLRAQRLVALARKSGLVPDSNNE